MIREIEKEGQTKRIEAREPMPSWKEVLMEKDKRLISREGDHLVPTWHQIGVRARLLNPPNIHNVRVLQSLFLCFA